MFTHSNAAHDPMIAAIDLGFGNTKYAYSRDASGHIACTLFPSRVATASDKPLSGGMIQDRDTVTVEAMGSYYEVGPDVDLAMSIHNRQVLNDKFIETPHYMALFKGALSYISTDTIDVLVVGLPVNLVSSKASLLRKKLQGEHIVAEGRKVYVHKVRVAPQPLGGFIHYAVDYGDAATMQEQTNLIIDPGNFTLDWLITNGFKANVKQSGSFPAGMSAIVKATAEALSKDLGINYENYAKIDKALRTGKFNLNGRSVDLKKYAQHALPIVEEGVHAIINNVGDLQDIDNIALVGGGASYYAEAIIQKYPHLNLLSSKDPVFANVKGFYHMGEQSIVQKAAA